MAVFRIKSVLKAACFLGCRYARCPQRMVRDALSAPTEDFDASVVKHADLEDNLSPKRGRGLNDKIRSKIYLGLEIIETKFPNLKYQSDK